MSRTEGDRMADISRIMHEQNIGYLTAEHVSESSYRLRCRIADEDYDPTPQHQWETTTPPEVYWDGDDEHGPENCGDCPQCGVIE